jgi:hypothetical protein|eukprot:2646433-Prymnesium_polylepis.1
MLEDEDENTQAKHAISLWKAGCTRGEAIDAMPCSGEGRIEWDCLLGSSADRGSPDCACVTFKESFPRDDVRSCKMRYQYAPTLYGPDTDLTNLAGHLGAADAGSACLLVLDEDLLLLLAYDMYDGNNDLLVLRCAREEIKVSACADRLRPFGPWSTFPSRADYVGFGTGCTQLTVGAALAYLENLFQTTEILACSPVLAVNEYDPQAAICLAPRGYPLKGDFYGDVA